MSQSTVCPPALLLVALAIGLVACDGTGSKPTSQEEPIEISSFEELRRIGQRQDLPLDGEYALTEDIDASGRNGQSDGGGFKPIGGEEEPFTGRFDGEGHSIVGLSLVGDSLETETLGLFGVVEEALIQNLRLEEVSIEGGYTAGMLVGRSLSSDILNVQVSGRIDSVESAGGMVGRNVGGTIENAVAEGTIQNVESGIGGLVGVNEKGTVRSSESSVDLETVGLAAGGLVGINDGGARVLGSVATGDVTGEGDFVGITGGLGGLVGSNRGIGQSQIKDSRATGTVTAKGGGAGGLVGLNYASHIENSQAMGRTVSEGGLAGGIAAVNWSARSGPEAVVRSSAARGDVVLREGALAGGLVANNSGGNVFRCSATGSVTLEVKNRPSERDILAAGGLIGRAAGPSKIVASKAEGSVAVIGDASGANAGGLIGKLRLSERFSGGVVSKSYATGRIGGIAAENAGGLIGTALSGPIRQSFAAGAVVQSTKHEGGLIGRNRTESSSGTSVQGATSDTTFWDAERMRQSNAVGDGKELDASGLTTSEMQGERAEADMAGFDFEETWQTVPGDYPALFWERQ